MNFILGGVTVHLVSATEYTEIYDRVDDGSINHRTQNGNLKRVIHWRKTSIDISGGGHMPSGLSGLDYTLDLEFSAATTQSITSSSNVIAIPAERRIDIGYEPCGFALFENQAKPTPVNMAGDIATLTPVANALDYMVKYYPKIIVAAEEPNDSNNRGTGNHRWSIAMEEV